jgi:ribonucleoside-triphosphate reductase
MDQMVAARAAPGSPAAAVEPFAQVRKRDGRLVPFDAAKITSAIRRAGQATGEFGEDVARQLTLRVLALLQAMNQASTPSVEDVQDVVETVLLSSTFKRTAKAYILYRDQHARIRQMVQQADVALMDQYLGRLDWNVRENSNMAYSLQGLNNYVSSEITKIYWLNRIYTPEVREAHGGGDFHLHDLGLLSVYCVGWDLQDLLMTGFRGAVGKVESKPAKHLRTALGQIVNFFYTLQGEAAGAQAFANFDTLLAPFVRADGLGYREVKQALQEFVFNLNVATRVGFQTPFTNVTLDLRVPAAFAAQPVVIGGQLREQTYAEYQAEMDVLNEALLEVLSEGDANGRVFTFPIPTYNVTPDFDWDAPGLRRLWELTARYGVPYFANFVNSDMSPDDARSMCCRLRLDTRMLQKRGGGLFSANPLTGSIGVVTLNLPRIGHLAADEADFMERLGRVMEIARTSLETKRKALESYTEAGLYPYTKYYLRAVKERFGAYWANHFSTVGLVGTNEACLNLLGRDIGTPDGEAFARRVLAFMRERLMRFQEETGNLYNLEATPAESAAYRLALLDKKRFGEAIEFAPGASIEVPFYTNSTQLPVNYTRDPFEAMQLQEGLQSMYTGGTVMHVFVGEAVPDPGAVREFVRTACERFSLPYLTVTPTFSVCPAHGYLAGEHHVCPRCGEAAEVYSRVVGYLRPVAQWNDGKRAEWSARWTFELGAGPSDAAGPVAVGGQDALFAGDWVPQRELIRRRQLGIVREGRVTPSAGEAVTGAAGSPAGRLARKQRTAAAGAGQLRLL